MTHQVEHGEKHFIFNPPLYIQRYLYVSQLVDQFNIKTLLDIGCAECKLIHLLKNNKNLNLIIGLDIDEQLLRNSKFILEPNNVEYVDKREQPLELNLLSGDISRSSDLLVEKIGNGQLDMISLVEVIEHMDDNCLVKCVDVVFSKLQPHYVLITTPNSEFNVVFGDKEGKFRHWDHKFEWTRKEFNEWCTTITQLYPQYQIISISGLGEAPKEFSNVGFCTQSVIFVNKQFNESNELKDYIEKMKHSNKKNKKSSYFESFNEKSSFKLIESIQYPFEYIDFKNKETRNKIFLEELDWLVRWLSPLNERGKSTINEEKEEYDENDLNTDDHNIILIERLCGFNKIAKLQIPFEEVVEIIRSKSEFGITKSGLYLIYSYPDTPEYSSRSTTPNSDNWHERSVLSNEFFNHEENWDNEINPSYRSYPPEIQFADAPDDPYANIEIVRPRKDDEEIVYNYRNGKYLCNYKQNHKIRKKLYYAVRSTRKLEKYKYLVNLNGQFDNIEE